MIDFEQLNSEKIKSKAMFKIAEEALHTNHYIGNYHKFNKDWFRFDRYAGTSKVSLYSRNNDRKRYIYGIEIIKDYIVVDNYAMMCSDNPFKLFKIILALCYHRKYFEKKKECPKYY